MKEEYIHDSWWKYSKVKKKTGTVTRGIGRKIISKKEMRGVIPFGPFLAIGIIVSAFIGEKIFNMYLDMFIWH